ncbi:hypothetical protein ACFXAW_32870 [Streptomyces sp. NPDC059445]|uniref:hypothetical protein n=1 Tax=Streptomyces sp. NPDC059445 TaxID=3346832 RepID=UPI003696AE07
MRSITGRRVATFGLLAAATMVTSGCGSDGPQSPKAAVDAFYDAGIDDDVNALTDALCPKYKGDAKEVLDEMFRADPITSIKHRSETMKSDHAVVVVDENSPGATTTYVRWVVTQDDGSWHVCGKA